MVAYNWDTSYAGTTINGAPIAAGAASTTETISNDQKLATEITIEAAYGATIPGGGVEVGILRGIDAAIFETTEDAPQSFTLPVAASATRRRAITVPGSISQFQVQVSNPAGNDPVAVTVRTRQATV